MKQIAEKIINEKKEKIIEEGKQIVQILGEDLAIFSIRQNLILAEKDNEKFKKTSLQILKYFKCKQCGKCCEENPVYLSDNDIENLYKFEGYNFFNKLDDNTFSNYLKMPCSYLEKNQCSIHKFNPETCRIYPFSLSRPFPTLVLCPMGTEIFESFKNFLKMKKISVKQNTEDFIIANAISELGMDIRKVIEPTTLDLENKKQNNNFDCTSINLEFLQNFEKYLIATKKEIKL